MAKEKTIQVSSSAELAKQLDENVLIVLGANTVNGFQKAFTIADAISKVKDLLTPEYMKPIMALQGNRLGFKTDKDKENGYPEAVVKNCVIEAVLTGVQPHGNQFNIIASNMYITKEGFGYLLSKVQGLSYDIVPQLPRIKDNSAAVVMDVSWSINGGERFKKSIDIPIKVNNFMGTDAVIGKATRKARAWLYNTIMGSEISDGDVSDVDRITIKVEPVKVNKELERISLMINDCKTEKELTDLRENSGELSEEVSELFNQRLRAINGMLL